LILFLKLPANDDELFKSLFETLQLEVEPVNGLIVAHGAEYRAAGGWGSITVAGVIALLTRFRARTCAK
jgi:hypothetical protein